MSAASIDRRLFFQHVKYCRREDDRDTTLKFDLSQDGGFLKHLLADEIGYFEFRQDCNMAGEYIRCFYTLKDNDKLVFQESSLHKPYMRWKLVSRSSRDGPIQMYRSSEDNDIWALIAQRFQREKSRLAYIAQLKS